jgi:hypothetical protein
MKALLGVIGVIVLVIAVIVGGSYGSLALYRTFAPQWEDARTDVYRNSKSYVEGTIRDLRRLQREYEAAEESEKSTLKTIIFQRSDELDYDKLPGELRRFIESL